MDIRFDGKTVLITGGTDGIGLASAELFGSLGAKVAVCGTNPEKLKRALERLERQGVTAFGEPCDVSEGRALADFSTNAAAALGPVDVWVGNAAVCPQYSILDTDEALWDRTVNTNLKSVYLFSRIAFDAMRDRGGVLLLASSFAALFPSVGSGVYAATKAAVSSMVKTLAAEMAPYGIRVNGYIPGVINTEMNRERIAADAEPLRSAIALQSFGEPVDVAWALAFLASDYARYITGTALEISGGKMGVQNPARAWRDRETRERTR